MTMNMKYQITDTIIPQEQRDYVNKSLLNLVTSNNLQEVTKEEIFNAYTGKGGLHGLNFSDYSSYHSYSTAKKEIEQGQFFTPHKVCKSIAKLINPTPTHRICDLTSGMGSFFNYFIESNCFGCEYDRTAQKISKFLFPKAEIQYLDLKYYKPEVRMDYILGNPPFNLNMTTIRGEEINSQFFYFRKALEVLNPLGIMIIIVPTSFLEDSFFNRSKIEEISKGFDFLGQYKLADDTFSQMGVKKFPTKVMAFQKRLLPVENEVFEFSNYSDYNSIKEAIQLREATLKNSTLEIRRALLNDDDEEFQYKLRKMMYEIKMHPAISENEARALAYIEKFKTQKCEDMDNYDDWYKNKRITKNKVLAYLRQILKKQVIKPSRKNTVIKTSSGFVGYDEKGESTKYNLQKSIIYPQYVSRTFPKGYKNLLTKKFINYTLQSMPFDRMELDSEISEFLESFTFLNKHLDTCMFNAMQKNDLNKIIQKPYAILAWQQGGGKTAASYAWSKYNPQRNTFIVSASLAINLTWIPFLTSNNENYVVVKKLQDIKNIKKGDYVLLSFYFLNKFKKQLKEYVKIQCQKVNLIFDESDEITNSKSKKTKSVLAIFRKVRRKLLATGTTTRNNIGELYSQLELLYNNSHNFICEPRYIYKEVYLKSESKTVLTEKENTKRGYPFPAKGGQLHFRRCFSPTKTTVFGIQQTNQDLYNESHLRTLIDKTIITRKFKEIAGDKYKIEHVSVYQNNAEREVYRQILEESHKLIKRYYTSTGNTRKDSMLFLLRRLQLLIDATSMPQTFSEYKGTELPNKASKILSMTAKMNEKVAIGTTSKYGCAWYYQTLVEKFPERKVFKIDGDVNFKKREAILQEFESTTNGILVCTQQAMSSSVNVPSVDKVIIESLQWNIPRIEQFYFRFIRYDSKNDTTVYFVNYMDTIEVNLIALLMAKEKLNDYIKTLEYSEDDKIYKEHGIDLNILDSLLTKEKDEKGKVQIKWGQTKVVK